MIVYIWPDWWKWLYTFGLIGENDCIHLAW